MDHESEKTPPSPTEDSPLAIDLEYSTDRDFFRYDDVEEEAASYASLERSSITSEFTDGVSPDSLEVFEVEVLSRYVPLHVLERLSHLDCNEVDQMDAVEALSDSFQGAVLFTDIAGYSKLTESLHLKMKTNVTRETTDSSTIRSRIQTLSQAAGSTVGSGEAGFIDRESTTMDRDMVRAGEELMTLLNKYFQPLIHTITSHQGDVITFAGDALFAVWRAQDASKMADAVQAAALCAWSIQVSMGQWEHEHVTLRTKTVVAASNNIVGMYVGGSEAHLSRLHWEYIITGDALTQVQTATELGLMKAGEVLLSPEAWAVVSTTQRMSSSKVGKHGHVKVSRIRSGLYYNSAGKKRPYLSPNMLKKLRNFVPEAVRLWAATTPGHRYNFRNLAVIRKVTVVFIGIFGLNYSRINSREQVQEAVLCIQASLAKHHGTKRQFLVEDKGSTFVGAFGVPPFSQPNAPELAVLFANEAQNALMSLGAGTTCSIGVATGRCLCGAVGSDARCDYTLVGDVVVLSARLMGSNKNDGRILCCEETMERCGAFEFRAVDGIYIKGKDMHITAYQPVTSLDGEVALRAEESPPPSPPQEPSVHEPSVHGSVHKGRSSHREKEENQEEDQSVSRRSSGRSIVGRERDIGFVMDHIGMANEEEAAKIIVVEGASGMGKTRLLAEIITLTPQLKSKTLVTPLKASELDRKVPFKVLRQLFVQLLAPSLSGSAPFREWGQRHLSEATCKKVLQNLGNLAVHQMEDDMPNRRISTGHMPTSLSHSGLLPEESWTNHNEQQKTGEFGNWGVFEARLRMLTKMSQVSAMVRARWQRAINARRRVGSCNQPTSSGWEEGDAYMLRRHTDGWKRHSQPTTVPPGAESQSQPPRGNNRSTDHHMSRGSRGRMSSMMDPTKRSSSAERSNSAELATYLQDLAPLLGPVLGVVWEDNMVTASIAQSERLPMTMHMLEMILRLATQQQRLVLLLDDAQWIDSHSLTLLVHCLEQMSNFVTVISTNLKDCGSNVLMNQLPETENVIWYSLQMLESEAVIELMCREMDVDSLPDSLVPSILSVVQGSPFVAIVYARTLVTKLTFGMAEDGHRRTLYVQGEDENTPSLLSSLPDTIQSMIQGRIDSLNLETQMMLKVASVLGNTFDVHMVWQLFPSEYQMEKVDIAELESNELVRCLQLQVETPSRSVDWGTFTYEFCNTHVRDIIYSSMTFDLRRKLHVAAAALLELNATFVNVLGLEELSNLAFHWAEGGEIRKALVYYNEASKNAQAIDKYADSVTFVNRMLMLSERDIVVIRLEQRIEWLNTLSSAYEALGHHAESIQAIECALWSMSPELLSCLYDEQFLKMIFLEHCVVPLWKASGARIWALRRKQRLKAGAIVQNLQAQLLSLNEDPNELRRMIVQLLLELYELYWDMMLYYEALKLALVAVWMVEDDNADPVLQALVYSAVSYIVIWKQMPVEHSSSIYNNFNPEEVSRYYSEKTMRLMDGVDLNSLSVEAMRVNLHLALREIEVGNITEGQTYLTQGIRIGQLHGRKQEVLEYHVMLAQLQFLRGDYDGSLSTGEKIMQAAEDLQNLPYKVRGILVKLRVMLKTNNLGIVFEILSAMQDLMRRSSVASDHDYYVSFLCLLTFGKLRNCELSASLAIACDVIKKGLHPNEDKLFRGKITCYVLNNDLMSMYESLVKIRLIFSRHEHHLQTAPATDELDHRDSYDDVLHGVNMGVCLDAIMQIKEYFTKVMDFLPVVVKPYLWYIEGINMLADNMMPEAIKLWEQSIMYASSFKWWHQAAIIAYQISTLLSPPSMIQHKFLLLAEENFEKCNSDIQMSEHVSFLEVVRKMLHENRECSKEPISYSHRLQDELNRAIAAAIHGGALPLSHDQLSSRFCIFESAANDNRDTSTTIGETNPGSPIHPHEEPQNHHDHVDLWYQKALSEVKAHHAASNSSKGLGQSGPPMLSLHDIHAAISKGPP